VKDAEEELKRVQNESPEPSQEIGESSPDENYSKRAEDVGQRIDAAMKEATQGLDQPPPPQLAPDEWPELTPEQNPPVRHRAEHQPTVERKERHSAWGQSDPPQRLSSKRPGRDFFQQLPRRVENAFRGVEKQVRVGVASAKQSAQASLRYAAKLKRREQLLFLFAFPFLYLIGPLLLAVLLVVGRGREWTQRSKHEQFALIPVLLVGGIFLAIMWYLFSPLLYCGCWGVFLVSLIRPVSAFVN